MMPSEIDIFRSAKLMIDQHGDDAPIHAAMQADKRMEAGDLDGCAVWKRVIRAIKEPQDRQPTVFSGKFTLAGIYTNWA